jgi:hypothetical protein
LHALRARPGRARSNLSGFTPDWLGARESSDHDARAPFDEQLRRYSNSRNMVSVIDLGAGTGSNLRYLARRLGPQQSWLCIDNDRLLLAELTRSLRTWPSAAFDGSRGSWILRDGDLVARVRCRELDMARDLDRLTLPGDCLVTASALLDLVSRQWLERLCEVCREGRATVAFALTYDGRVRCSPGDSDDAFIRTLVDEHQSTDKGFGPAMGPQASNAIFEIFGSAGYELVSQRSDWQIGPEQTVLQQQLLEGWRRAALEIAPDQRRRIDAWSRRRARAIAERQSRILVGHRDFWGSPAP